MKFLLPLLMLSFSSLFAFEHLTIDNFDEKLKNKNAIVDFYASWCPPCKVVNKTLETYSENKPSDVTVYKVDIMVQKQLMKRFDIQNIPVLLYVKDGQIEAKKIGLVSVDDVRDNVQKYIR